MHTAQCAPLPLWQRCARIRARPKVKQLPANRCSLSVCRAWRGRVPTATERVPGSAVAASRSSHVGDVGRGRERRRGRSQRDVHSGRNLQERSTIQAAVPESRVLHPRELGHERNSLVDGIHAGGRRTPCRLFLPSPRTSQQTRVAFESAALATPQPAHCAGLKHVRALSAGRCTPARCGLRPRCTRRLPILATQIRTGRLRMAGRSARTAAPLCHR